MRHHLVLGDQLDRRSAAFDGFDAAVDRVWMAEVAGESTHVWSTKPRIAVFLAAMRHFRDRLRGEDLFSSQNHFLKRGVRNRKEVCLTIDDGPHPSACGDLLDALKDAQVPATFFVVGMRVKQHPEYIRRMIAEGHEVGNHTQDHIRLDTLSPKQVRDEIANCATNVQRAAGVKMTLFRPPGMRWNDDVMAEIKRQGYLTIGWNVGAKDFTGKEHTPEEVEERVMKQLGNGVIILLHDNPVTAAALPNILRRAKADGYRFISTTEMLSRLPKPVAVIANPPAATLASRN